MLVTGFFAYEHILVFKSLDNIDMAFFTMNGYISITFFVFMSLSIAYYYKLI
jgi:hypothetical protein